ncbi:hypothetical protein LZ30DRAFT_714674 [Colletotrichum cereale]|nr:hypothetical protein LZ30DRAFT_714674 [Colletotrichum cereale]
MTADLHCRQGKEAFPTPIRYLEQARRALVQSGDGENHVETGCRSKSPTCLPTYLPCSTGKGGGGGCGRALRGIQDRVKWHVSLVVAPSPGRASSSTFLSSQTTKYRLVLGASGSGVAAEWGGQREGGRGGHGRGREKAMVTHWPFVRLTLQVGRWMGFFQLTMGERRECFQKRKSDSGFWIWMKKGGGRGTKREEEASEGTTLESTFGAGLHALKLPPCLLLSCQLKGFAGGGAAARRRRQG